jgi:alkyldihydroxyacetonephosphate synthase
VASTFPRLRTNRATAAGWPAARAILAFGGTITHHHEVARDRRPWSDAQRPDAFAAAPRAAQAALDRVGLLNLGVLIDP